MNKTIILGLDGANWELLDPWIEEGALPNIASLKDKSAWGDHQSQLPPTTFPNWKCYSTGRDPGKLGVYWFEVIDLDEKEVSIPNSRSFQGREMWDYLNDFDLSVGVINMPTMFPPKPLDGFVVCGGPGTTDGVYRDISGGYTYPEELAEELEKEFDYKVHPTPYLTSREDSEEEVDAILELLEKRLELTLEKMEEVDVVHTTLFYLNVLQHFYWNEEPVEKAWKLIDKYIGEIKEKCDENGYNLVLMSDHGCTEIHTKFYINRWLEQEGYYVRKDTKDDFLRKIGFNRENLMSIVKRLELERLVSYVPEFLQRMVPHEEGAVRHRKVELADWNESVAVASGQGPIYLDIDREEKNYEEVRNEIIEKLRVLESPYTGEKLFEKIHRAEELYSELNGSSPDIVVSQNKGVTISDRVGGGDLFDTPTKWRAENKQTGMFVFYGPSFEDSGEIQGAEITDIAPTLLMALTGSKIDSERDALAEIISSSGKKLPREKGEVSGIDF